MRRGPIAAAMLALASILAAPTVAKPASSKPKSNETTSTSQQRVEMAASALCARDSSTIVLEAMKLNFTQSEVTALLNRCSEITQAAIDHLRQENDANAPKPQ